MFGDAQVTAITSAISALVAITQFLPIAIIAFVFLRTLVRILVKLFAGWDYDLVPGLDCATTFKSMRTYDSLLNLFMEMDGRITLSQLKCRLERNLVDARNPDGSLKHPKLRMTYKWFLGFRIMSCKRHQFDINRHFAYVTDREGNPRVCQSDGDLEDVLERIGNAPIFSGDETAEQYPPWKFYIVYRTKPRFLDQQNEASSDQSRNREKDDRVTTCFILRIDHVIIDGGSLGLTLMPTLLDFDDPSDDPTVIFQNMKPLTSRQRAVINTVGFLLTPLVIFRIFLLWLRGHDRNAIHQRMGKREGRYFLAPKSFPALSKLVDIRRKTDVKINTIISTCLVRAIFKLSQSIVVTNNRRTSQWRNPSLMHKAAEENGAEREGLWMQDPKTEGSSNQKGSSSSSTSWTCTLTIPHSLWVPGDKLELKNQSTGMGYLLTERHVGLMDPIEALNAVQASLEEPSRMSLAWATGLLMKITFNTLPGCIVDAMSLPIQRTTAVFSNVRSSEKVQKCFGCDVVQMVAYISMWENLDIGFVAGSYANKVTIGLAGRKGSFDSRSELRKLLQFFEEELESLHEAATLSKKVD